ncbi:hypothetical protein L3X38_007874 [Prunus dulcis]|uniref:Uncharacterized protein n=1 Tax=Prunus dulcis TaxID=3755 RepID=A0AAD5F6H0_PRUDU|nr:hypothetical protein L3X38_007874 [Prunus dulcis]
MEQAWETPQKGHKETSPKHRSRYKRFTYSQRYRQNLLQNVGSLVVVGPAMDYSNFPKTCIGMSKQRQGSYEELTGLPNNVLILKCSRRASALSFSSYSIYQRQKNNLCFNTYQLEIGIEQKVM